MEYLRVRNWEKFQHYKDRTPPWIKLQRDLLNNYEFECLQDASKAHLILIWLLASQLDNKIPNDPKWIAKKIGANQPVNLKTLIEHGFICVVQDASTAQAKRTLETEAYKQETEREKKGPPPQKRKSRIPQNWQLTDHLREYVKTRRPDLLPEDVAEAFHDYWLADGRTKLDWDRAFMTWVRNENSTRSSQSAGNSISDRIGNQVQDAINDARQAEASSDGAIVAGHG